MRANEAVERVSSAHPAVNQMEYQAEVPQMAHNCYTHILTAFREELLACDASDTYRTAKQNALTGLGGNCSGSLNVHQLVVKVDNIGTTV